MCINQDSVGKNCTDWHPVQSGMDLAGRQWLQRPHPEKPLLSHGSTNMPYKELTVTQSFVLANTNLSTK